MIQSPSWQRKYLADAERHGDLHKLYWCIEMLLPLRYRKNGLDNGRTYVTYPGFEIPVVSVLPYPKLSLVWANLLAEWFAATNPRDHEFYPIIVTRDLLDATGRIWYEWDEPVPRVNTICPNCGVVNDCYCVPNHSGIPTIQ